LALLSSTLAPSCGGGGDQTAKFVGPWTFASGSLMPMCPIAGVPTFNLAGLNVAFEKVDDSTISLVINTGCTVKFSVSGNKATAPSGQTCALDLGPPLGPQSITIKTWTLVLTGNHIDATIAGQALICTAMGTAVLVPGATDAGAHDTGRDTSGMAGSAGADGAAGAGGSAGTGAGGASGAGGNDGGGSEAATDTGPETAVDAPGAE
jgi:hypothetical protein